MTQRPQIILIDNYDSFSHNLARYAGLAGMDVSVIRNDAASAADIIARQPDGIILSPGPCTPAKAGICIDVLRRAADIKLPVLGICLGHQAIADAFGGYTLRCPEPLHGQASVIQHDQSNALLANIPPSFQAGRYHALSVDISNAPNLTAFAHHGDIIMGMAHNAAPIYGLQFHPESILTPDGLQMLRNFTKIVIDS